MAFLDDLPPDLRAKVNRLTVSRELAPGQLLALEGEPCSGLFVVASGLVRVYKVAADGREQVLLLARPGDSVADAAAFLDQPMPASVSAVERSTVQIIPLASLNRLLDDDPRFARAVIRHLCQKLQHVVHVVEDLSFLHVRARVAKILLQSLHPQEGVGAGVGRRPLTHREIAEIAGTAREVVSRALGSFEDQGLIRIDRGAIEVLDPERLAALQ
jgi:CRP/FNR family transcriptional regulator